MFERFGNLGIREFEFRSIYFENDPISQLLNLKP
jgi:hypothetical protein